MKDDLIDFLKKMDKGEIPSNALIAHPGFNRAIESEAIKLDKNMDIYIMTAHGYNLLQRWYVLEATRDLKRTIKSFDESTSKINKELLGYTKAMKILTKWILGFTITNLIFIIIQILITKGVI